MKFYEALKECLNGKRITRRDWNGTGMYVYYTPPSKIWATDWYGADTLTADEKERGYIEIAGHFDMMNAQRIRIIGWAVTQTDMASDQWEVLE